MMVTHCPSSCTIFNQTVTPSAAAQLHILHCWYAGVHQQWGMLTASRCGKVRAEWWKRVMVEFDTDADCFNPLSRCFLTTVRVSLTTMQPSELRRCLLRKKRLMFLFSLNSLFVQPRTSSWSWASKIQFTGTPPQHGIDPSCGDDAGLVLGLFKLALQCVLECKCVRFFIMMFHSYTGQFNSYLTSMTSLWVPLTFCMYLTMWIGRSMNVLAKERACGEQSSFIQWRFENCNANYKVFNHLKLLKHPKIKHLNIGVFMCLVFLLHSLVTGNVVRDDGRGRCPDRCMVTPCCKWCW